MLKNTAIVTLFLIFSSVLGFVSQIVFVSSFGASIEMDIYFTLLSIPTIITGMAPVVFASVLLPKFAQYKSNEIELNLYIHSLWVYIVLFAIVFSVIGCFLSIYNIDKLIPKLTISLRKEAVEVCIMVWIGSGLSLSSGFLAAILNYNKRFIKVVWTSILPAFLMILSVLILHEKIGIRSIALGFSLAFLLQFIIFRKAVVPIFSSKSFKIIRVKNSKKLLSQALLVIMSLLPFTIIVPIGYYWASFLSEGSASYLGYSQGFAGFLSVATGMGIAIVSFPDLADDFAKGKGLASLYKFEVALRYVLMISIFAAVAFISLRIPILTLFYQHGSFHEESVQKLASVVPWYLIAAIFVAGLNLLRTLFYSKGEYMRIAIFGLVIPIIFFILAGVLKERFSFVGIGIANAVSFAILFSGTVYLAKNKELKVLTNKFLFFIFKNVTVSVIAGFAVELCFPIILVISSQVVSIIVCLLLFTSLYFIIARFIFKLKEIIEIELLIVNKVKLIYK